jgi:hypothetical protein
MYKNKSYGDCGMDEIKIAFDMEDIEQKTESEKLNLLLKIAFSNHSVLSDHSKILFGNGKQGLCDVARYNKAAINSLWAVFVLAIIGFASILFTHIGK